MAYRYHFLHSEIHHVPARRTNCDHRVVAEDDTAPVHRNVIRPIGLLLRQGVRYRLCDRTKCTPVYRGTRRPIV
ncbi:hypothetical protein CA13_62270 [Planctomycetes bacterium CA13]|uniref:Uncharacterized protein n=1 Tax=Novipirellula herctigrandis TaxID=2527986 RepID=A0A5C5ZC62_9BACT|nr:hypothetical protein CA13_62270 [Planctomycetes bacterium CA13]